MGVNSTEDSRLKNSKKMYLYDMQVSFTTKEESKAAQQEAFLKLSGYERFVAFVRLSEQILSTFPSSVKEDDKGNFIIDASMLRK